MPRISLRQLLLLTAAVALALASLKYASGLILALLGFVAMFSVLLALIVAVVDRGPRQMFALGFAITVISYVLLIKEGELAGSRDPVSIVLNFLHDAIAKSGYVDQVTGQMVPNDTAKALLAVATQPGAPTPSIAKEWRPTYEHFNSIGHVWWELVIGCFGGQLARLIYIRRLKEQTVNRQPPASPGIHSP